MKNYDQIKQINGNFEKKPDSKSEGLDANV